MDDSDIKRRMKTAPKGLETLTSKAQGFTNKPTRQPSFKASADSWSP